MSGTKTAPGPWRVAELDRRVIEDSEGNVVADVREWRDPENANLIAAAPRLRDSLTSMLAVAEYAANALGSEFPMDGVIVEARRALSAARGETADGDE